MIFTTENFLKDNGDKIPADQKPGIEQALQQLKDAHKAADVAAIDSAIANLNQVMQAASAQMYQGGAQPGAGAGAGAQGFNGAGAGQQGGAKPGAGAQAGDQPGADNGAKADDNIQDDDFEEAK